MKLSLRLISLLAIGILLVTLVVTWNEVQTEQSARQSSLQKQAEILNARLQDIIEPELRQGALKQVSEEAERFAAREHLVGVAIYDAQGQPLAITSALFAATGPTPTASTTCAPPADHCGALLAMGDRPIYAYSTTHSAGRGSGEAVTTFNDASELSISGTVIWRRALTHVVPQILLVVFVTIAVVQSTVLRPIAKTARWIKDLRFGRATTTADSEDGGLLDPISAAAAGLAETLASARASAEEEARLREAGDSLWTPERLRVGIQNRLHGNRLFVVSNREPYQHVCRGNEIDVLVPASGVVTALEPVLCACDGTWIAHGSADADRAVVDARDHVRVPPDHARYTLRRVWLTREEEDGYYFGFANEGLWPLCHIAHTRPLFRATDWEEYQRVNRKFAEVTLEEMEGAESLYVLVQDYHLALLPRLIKARRPDARVAMFWHIPWPNPEAFGICPWQRELLDGLLGADIVGFHIQAHCRHFLQTIDRSLECRIEWERLVVNRNNHSTLVRPHPISVAFPDPDETTDRAGSSEDRMAVRRNIGASGVFLGVGVDRIDYTKGIVERFRAIERFLEKYPAYQELFSFAQVGAPSRTEIARYHDLVGEVKAEADRINRRFQIGGWKPILLFGRHHAHRDITPLYKSADLCLVTSLHDGMNLVAKEFVSHRADEDGVLILSQFAGASCELRDALLVNPYDIEQVADAIRLAIEMPLEERRTRMRHMRRVVKEHNVFRWAAELVSDLAEVRSEGADTAAVPAYGASLV
jgi:trehalose-6-phosphate synthase